MPRIGRVVKLAVALLAAIVVAGAGWLFFAPPELIRVGSAYAAKIVCSNVFLAKRDAREVLSNDVQAPGHPLLRIMRVSVDEDTRSVTAGLLGVFGKGTAIAREGLGCTTVPNGDAQEARGTDQFAANNQPASTMPWPQGNLVTLADNPPLQHVLDDPMLTGPGMRAVVVVHDGKIVGERYGEGFSAETPLLGWSMTKTVTAAILGTLVKDGRLSLDRTGLFQSWDGSARADISLASMLEMSSGLAWNEGYGTVSDVTRMLYLEPDMAAYAASKPYDPENGNPDGDSRFNYSSGTSVMLSDVWMRAVEAPVSYPWRALFDPLGMSSATFEMDAAGTFVGSSYMYATARDWARFGQLLLQRGAWNGRSLLPSGFVDWMTEPASASETAWGGHAYGRHVWLVGPRGSVPRGEDPEAAFDLPADTFWLRGHDGQTVTVIPSRDLVVVRMGLTPSDRNYQPQGLVDALVKALAGQ